MYLSGLLFPFPSLSPLTEGFQTEGPGGHSGPCHPPPPVLASSSYSSFSFAKLPFVGPLALPCLRVS